jgi:uncharacterized protein (TIGR02271 family)
MAELNIQRNARVLASDGEVGRVSHVIVDSQTKEVTHLVVERDGDDYEVPMTAVQRVEGDRVTLQGDRSAVGRRFDRAQYHEVDEDEVRSDTTRTAQRGGAPLQDADEDEVQVGSTRQPREELRQRDATRPGRLQLREERLRVSKEQEQAGEVRLGTRVVEHQETVNVPVREERVVIERTSVTGQVTPGEITGTNETIEVPVMRERANIEKETVVTEEVDVRTEAVEHTERVRGTVREEELVVEGDTEAVLPTKDGQLVHDHTGTGRSARS